MIVPYLVPYSAGINQFGKCEHDFCTNYTGYSPDIDWLAASMQESHYKDIAKRLKIIPLVRHSVLVMLHLLKGA